jgi:glycogen debranching enzyme
MAIVMSHFDLTQAKNELRALVSHQFENGMFPHIIYWQHTAIPAHLKIAWGKRHTSSITQPPLLAEAVMAIYKRDPDITFVREMLPSIHKFHQFLYRHRDPRKSGLVGIINPDESGEDTSPRFDEALELGPRWSLEENYSARMKLVNDWREARFVVRKRMDLKHWVRDVGYNSILAESLHLTARLAALSGSTDITEWSEQHHRKTTEAMRAQFNIDGLFFSTMNIGERVKHIDIMTWNIFMPLYAGVAMHEEALLLKNLLLEDSFSTPYGVPTVALNEPSFDLDAVWPWPNWRGPVWIGANWFIVKGLRRYGYNEAADAITNQSRLLLEKSGFREFYNPFSGEGYGAEGFTWGGLVLDMLSQQ